MAVLYFPINGAAIPGWSSGPPPAAYVGRSAVDRWASAKQLAASSRSDSQPGGASPHPAAARSAPIFEKSCERCIFASIGFALMLATAVDALSGRARWLVPSALILLLHFAALQHNC